MSHGKIPRRYFWLFDFTVLGLALVAADFLLPSIQKLIALSGLARLPWVGDPAILLPWGGGEPGIVVLEFLWVFLPMIPSTILCMELLGGYRELLNQSYTRMVINGLLSPMIGFSLIATALVMMKSSIMSRLYFFSFMFLGALGLCIYRIAMRMYFMRRRTAGRYARNVLLIGMPSGIDFMAHHLRHDPYSIDYKVVGYLDLLPSKPVDGVSVPGVDQQPASKSAAPDTPGRE